MVTITHPDQIARIREQETDGPMFPRGMRQCLAYCFAIEGVSVHERTPHARLIDMMRDDYIEYFPLDGINMSGHTALERVAECAKIRESIRRLLVEMGDEVGYWAICAKSSPMGLQSKIVGMDTVGRVAMEKLNQGRYVARRGQKYIADVVTHVCSPVAATTRCSVTAISRRYQVAHSNVCKDIDRVEHILNENIDRSIAILESVFMRSGII